MTAHDDWQVERMQPPEMPPCRCGHEYHEGQCGELQRRWNIDFDPFEECDCPGYQAADAEDLRQDEFPENL